MILLNLINFEITIVRKGSISILKYNFTNNDKKLLFNSKMQEIRGEEISDDANSTILKRLSASKAKLEPHKLVFWSMVQYHFEI